MARKKERERERAGEKQDEDTQRSEGREERLTHERFMACTDGHIRNAAGRASTRFSFSRSCRKVPRIAGPVARRSLATSVKRPGPVKSVSVIAPRRRRLISCPETKIATERKEGEKEEERESEGSERGKIRREESRRLFLLLVASYRGERYTYIGPEGGYKFP